MFGPIGNATHYHATYVLPYWASSVALIGRIGTHVFYTWKGQAGTAAAFRHADAARLGPWGFSALPVSFALDYAVWDQAPDPAMLAGAAVVVLACVMSERAARDRPRSPLPLAGRNWRDSVRAAQGIAGGKRWAPSPPSGSAATERTAESGSGP